MANQSTKSITNCIHEKDEIVDSIKANDITDITLVGKGYVTFDALNLMAENNIKLIAINPRGSSHTHWNLLTGET